MRAAPKAASTSFLEKPAGLDGALSGGAPAQRPRRVGGYPICLRSRRLFRTGDDTMALRHPRNARLLRPADFAALRENSRRVSSTHFSMQFRANAQTGARLGMAVSRRVSKLAVVRNRIRRQIRESFRLTRNSLPAVDILVIARTQAATQPNPTLRAELEILWQALKSKHPAPLKEASTTGTMRAC